MKSGMDLINDAKRQIAELSPQEAMALHGQPNTVFLDVRDQTEVNLGKIPGAVHISRGTMETNVEARVPRESKVVLYCASGNRSALAAVTLQQMGYGDVASMAGGFRGWAEQGGAIEG